MFSLRLPPELEAQLDRYAISNGVAKNAVVAQALAQFFKTVDTRTVPLEEPVQEAGIEESAYDRHVRKTQEQQKLYLEAHKIAESIRLNEIWTKKADAGAGVTPGIYGRNVIVGFTDSMRGPDHQLDGKLYVISRNLASVGLGTDSFHLYVTEYHDWKEYMRTVAKRG